MSVTSRPRVTLEAIAPLKDLTDFDDRPDTADDVFLLASSALANCPGMVLTDSVLPVLIKSAAAGILVQHRWAAGGWLPMLQCWHTAGL